MSAEDDRIKEELAKAAFSIKLMQIMHRSITEQNRSHLRLVARDGKIISTPPPPPPPPLRETATEEKKRADYVKFYMQAAEWGYKPGWAAYRYKDKYGEWPPAEFKMT
jgi:hypothetical protein